MQKKTLLLALGALALLVVRPATPALAEPDTAVHPAIWVVRDQDTTLYLFGGSHALKPGVRWLDGPVKTAFAASSEVVLEVIEPVDPAETRQAVMSRARSTDGIPLTDKIGASRRGAFAALLGGLGMPAAALDGMQPWFAALIIGTAPLGKLGFDPALGVESVLTQEARRTGKTLVGLETMDEQLGIFSASPPEAQVAYLERLIDEKDQVGPVADAILERWESGDIDSVAERMNAAFTATPALAKRLVADRNRRWADWLVARMDRPGTVFVAVGGGHLGGPGNLRALLAARGLRAIRLAW